MANARIGLTFLVMKIVLSGMNAAVAATPDECKLTPVRVGGVIYAENFDGPAVKPSQSVLDAPLDWKLVGPNDAAKQSVGGVFLGAGKYGWIGNYLDGSTASAQAAENVVARIIPAINSGQVVLSCRAFAAGKTSAGSQISLRPFLSRFFNRGGGWISTETGWEFWVGRVHSNPYPTGERKFGPYQIVKTALTGGHDVTIDLRMTVDLDHNTAWGEAAWNDAQGQAQRFKTDTLDWDSAGGDLSRVVVSIDRRSGHTGIALDNLKVEGELPSPKPHPFEQGAHYVVRQFQGEKEPRSLPAEIQWFNKPWKGENAALPYLAYMSEKDRLLMLVGCGQSFHAATMSSDDHGKTWSPRRWLRVDKAGQPNASAMGLTYLGNGELLCYSGDMNVRWFSPDYGQTWQESAVKASPASRNYWDPLLVKRGGDGRVERVAQGWWKPTGVPWGSSDSPYSQAYFRFSLDQGRSWSDDVKVPQWLGVNEVDIIVAPNGDWVAACRTDNAKRLTHTKLDDYSGLGISISKDEGKTWSDLNLLHEYGRHHPCMAILLGGRIVMSYVVRIGYPNTDQGFPQFGIEAVVSSDNGRTWDLGRRYVLAEWTGNTRGEEFYLGAPQSTSTVVLPEGTILTAFATGFRNAPGVEHSGATWKTDVMIVKWRVSP